MSQLDMPLSAAILSYCSKLVFLMEQTEMILQELSNK